MIIFNFIYAGFYQLSEIIRNNIRGSIFYEPAFDATILLSCFEFLNIISIRLYFNLKITSGNYKLDMLLTAIILFGSNSIIFLWKKRYAKIAKEMGSRYDIFCLVGAIAYAILTVCVFCYLHSRSLIQDM